MNNIDDPIITPDQKFLEELQKWSHDFHMHFSDVMSVWANEEKRLTDQTLDFCHRTIQIIGIFAGFGFTAISQVKNLGLFLFGEFFLGLAILIGTYNIKKYYETNLNSVQSTSDDYSEKFKKKSDFFIKYIGKARNFETININDFQNEIDLVDKNILSLTNNQHISNKSKFIDQLLLVFIVGCIFILLSFLNLKINFCIKF